MTRPHPTLRAVGPTEEPEGFPVLMIEDLGGEPWIVETVGMRASDVGDALDNERMARLAAASPALLYACRAALVQLTPGCEIDYREVIKAAIALTGEE